MSAPVLVIWTEQQKQTLLMLSLSGKQIQQRPQRYFKTKDSYLSAQKHCYSLQTFFILLVEHTRVGDRVFFKCWLLSLLWCRWAVTHKISHSMLGLILLSECSSRVTPKKCARKKSKINMRNDPCGILQWSPEMLFCFGVFHADSDLVSCFPASLCPLYCILSFFAHAHVLLLFNSPCWPLICLTDGLQLDVQPRRQTCFCRTSTYANGQNVMVSLLTHEQNDPCISQQAKSISFIT